jgi:hypothetical protein
MSTKHVKDRAVSILPVPESNLVALSENIRSTGNEQRYTEEYCLQEVFPDEAAIKPEERMWHIMLLLASVISKIPSLICFGYPKQFVVLILKIDRLCGLVFRVPGYRSRGPGFDFRHYQIF